MDSKEQKEILEAYKALLEGSRELKLKTKLEMRAVIQKIEKLDAINSVELSEIARKVGSLQQEVLTMLKSNRNLNLDSENRYFFLLSDKEESWLRRIKSRGGTLAVISSVAILIATFCFIAAGYLFYTNLILPIENNERFNVGFYAPVIIVSASVFVCGYLIQTLRVFSSVVDYRTLNKERVELGKALYTTENTLLKLVESKNHEKGSKKADSAIAVSEDNKESRVALWSQYDGVIVDYLYKKRKSM